MDITKRPTLLLGLAATVFCGCEKETEIELIRPVRAIKVGDVAGLNAASFPGRAKAAEEVNLAFRVSGELVDLPIAVGTNVKKGDLLARVDQRDFQAAVDSADAELQRAIARLDAMKIARPEEIRRHEALVLESEAVLALAEAEYQRALELEKQDIGAVSKSELDRSKGARDRSAAVLEQQKESLTIAREGARQEDVRAQEAEIKSLEAKLATARNELVYTELVAPFDGTIAAQYVENFQTVQAGQTVCRLLATDQIEIVVDIPESKITMAPYVRDLVCVFDAFPDVPITDITVTEIGTEASATTRTYPVTLVMNQPDESTGARILPGMAGRVRGKARLNDEAESDGFVIPESAVFEAEDGNKYVWTVDENGATVHRSDPVTPGETSALGIRVKGIEPGQWIVTAGVHYLEEGQRVILPTEPAVEPDGSTTGESIPEAEVSPPGASP